MKFLILVLILVSCSFGPPSVYENEDNTYNVVCNYPEYLPPIDRNLIPFTQLRSSSFGMGNIPGPGDIAYREGEALYGRIFGYRCALAPNCRPCNYCGRPAWFPITPYAVDLSHSDDDYFVAIMRWTEPHTGISHWVRDVEIIDGILIINTTRLDFGGGGAAITNWGVRVYISREYLEGIYEHQIVTRNVYWKPRRVLLRICDNHFGRNFTADQFQRYNVIGFRNEILSAIRIQWVMLTLKTPGTRYANETLEYFSQRYYVQGGWTE